MYLRMPSEKVTAKNVYAVSSCVPICRRVCKFVVKQQMLKAQRPTSPEWPSFGNGWKKCYICDCLVKTDSKECPCCGHVGLKMRFSALSEYKKKVQAGEILEEPLCYDNLDLLPITVTVKAVQLRQVWQHHCLRCDNEWASTSRKPWRCPGCRSNYWNQPQLRPNIRMLGYPTLTSISSPPAPSVSVVLQTPREILCDESRM